MKKVEEADKSETLTEESKAMLEHEIGLSDARTCIFRKKVFYLHNNNVEDDEYSKKLQSLQIKFCGGTMRDSISDDVTHVVVEDLDDVDQSVKDVRSKRMMEGKRLFHVVTPLWLQTCVQEGRLVET